jgi:hypothetical protein
VKAGVLQVDMGIGFGVGRRQLRALGSCLPNCGMVYLDRGLVAGRTSSTVANPRIQVGRFMIGVGLVEMELKVVQRRVCERGTGVVCSVELGPAIVSVVSAGAGVEVEDTDIVMPQIRS